MKLSKNREWKISENSLHKNAQFDVCNDHIGWVRYGGLRGGSNVAYMVREVEEGGTSQKWQKS